MELFTFNTDISSFYPHILRKIHAQFNTIIINDNSEAVLKKIRGPEESTFRGYVSNCFLRQGSRWRAKKSPCGCSLRFVLVPKEKWKSPSSNNKTQMLAYSQGL